MNAALWIALVLQTPPGAHTPRASAIPDSRFAPGALHRARFESAGDERLAALRAAGAVRWEIDYGGFVLAAIDEGRAGGEDALRSSGLEWHDEHDLVALNPWTDAPGATIGAPFVNNLDLTVKLGTTTYRGNVFSGAISVGGGTADIRNNVECVFLPAGTSGVLTVRVIASAIVGDGVPGNGDQTDQDFALFVYNARGLARVRRF